ncbi:hypothetical protein J7E88_07085 [Streptomyces sp. ISL-10]|uniref:hypothetical protein n=1 Tax=Streptomyces sp. ISL-10 TaxID=2819172 RepID=UPI001BE87DB9|nr:hypothetical protein [Streptomyces sp. ISL-10]MBT2365088.1 hypothetical protein [Streptomyces sp. ISL-10]
MNTGTRGTARRIATAAAAVALTCAGATACEDDDEGTPDGKHAATSASPADAPTTNAPTASAEPGPAERPSSGRTLTEAELTRAALVTGDVPGYEVTPLQGGDEPGTEKADKPACAPLAAVINGAPEPAAAATVYRTAVDSTEEGKETQTVVTLILTSHSDGGAEQLLASLRTAVDACAGGFTTHSADSVSTYSDVQKLPAPQAGDESVAYRVTGAVTGAKVPLVFHVVRRDASVATFYTANFLDAKTPDVPAELIREQTAKLP